MAVDFNDLFQDSKDIVQSSGYLKHLEFIPEMA